jgi:hypothetical protein
MDGKMELITCSTDGESEKEMEGTNIFTPPVRGYLPASPDTQRNMMELNVEQETMRELGARRQVYGSLLLILPFILRPSASHHHVQNLLLELKNYEANQKQKGIKGGPLSVAGEEEVGMIPAQTQLQTSLAISLGTESKAVRPSIPSYRACIPFYFALLLLCK